MKTKDFYCPPQLNVVNIRPGRVLCDSVRGVYDSGIDDYDYEDKSSVIGW